MKTGKAYAFLDFKGREGELIGIMELAKVNANFSRAELELEDTFNLEVLDDKVGVEHGHKRKKLPKSIANLARTTKVYGSVPISMIENLSNIRPKRAADLRYLVRAQDSEASDSESAVPLGQGRANQETAGMLDAILSMWVGEDIGSKVFRYAVFYQDSRGRAQRY